MVERTPARTPHAVMLLQVLKAHDLPLNAIYSKTDMIIPLRAYLEISMRPPIDDEKVLATKRNIKIVNEYFTDNQTFGPFPTEEVDQGTGDARERGQLTDHGALRDDTGRAQLTDRGGLRNETGHGMLADMGGMNDAGRQGLRTLAEENKEAQVRVPVAEDQHKTHWFLVSHKGLSAEFQA